MAFTTPWLWQLGWKEEREESFNNCLWMSYLCLSTWQFSLNSKGTDWDVTLLPHLSEYICASSALCAEKELGPSLCFKDTARSPGCQDRHSKEGSLRPESEAAPSHGPRKWIWGGFCLICRHTSTSTTTTSATAPHAHLHYPGFPILLGEDNIRSKGFVLNLLKKTQCLGLESTGIWNCTRNASLLQDSATIR